MGKSPLDLEYQNYRNVSVMAGESPKGKITYRKIRAYFERIGLLEPLSSKSAAKAAEPTLRDALEGYFHEEYPSCAVLSDIQYLKLFEAHPDTPVKLVDLTVTYNIARHFNEEHGNVVEAFIIEAGLTKC